MSKINLVPAPGFVLVRPLDVKEKTASGIVLPESAKEKPLKGEVIAVGDKVSSVWDKIKEGAVIIYKKWAGNEYRPTGWDEELLFVKTGDILALEK